MTTTADPAAKADQAAAFADRVLDAALGSLETFSIHVGNELGLYASLDTDGPATAAGLAERVGAAPRYVREWLEQQAAYELLDVTDLETEPTFSLPEAHAEVLARPLDPSHLAPLAKMLVTAMVQSPALLNAYRNGGGVGWAEYGGDMLDSQAELNRPFFHHELANAVVAMPRVHALLSADGARGADVGCGGGWSTIALGIAYPGARFDGYDIDEPSIELARRNAADAGVGDRVRFHTVDVSDLETAGHYDATFAFECIHDLPQPVAVLAAMRRMTDPAGAVVVMDEAVGDSFAGPADEIERLMYGFSLTICLPDGLSHPPSVGTGTVIRPDTLRGYAQDAGFTDIEASSFDAGFWRFYELLL